MKTQTLAVVMVLLVGILGVGGCASIIENKVASNLEKVGINPNPPDMNKLAPYVGNDPTLQFYFKVLGDYQNFFVNLKSRPLSSEEKEKEIKYYNEVVKKRMIQDSIEKTGMKRHEAVAMAKESSEYFNRVQVLSELPTGAIYGAFNKPYEFAVGEEMNKSTIVNIYYPASSIEDARKKMKELASVLSGFLSHDSRWNQIKADISKDSLSVSSCMWTTSYQHTARESLKGQKRIAVLSITIMALGEGSQNGKASDSSFIRDSGDSAVQVVISFMHPS